MKLKNQYKSCKRIKCPYYAYKLCPHRNECEHSKDISWVKAGEQE